LALGCSLLKEFAFKFLTYTSEEVTPATMKAVILKEYVGILRSLVKANSLATELVNSNTKEKTEVVFKFFE